MSIHNEILWCSSHTLNATNSSKKKNKNYHKECCNLHWSWARVGGILDTTTKLYWNCGKAWNSLSPIDNLGRNSNEMRPRQNEPTRVTRELQRIQTRMAITFITNNCKKRCKYHSAYSKDDFHANCKVGYCYKPIMLHGWCPSKLQSWM